VIKGLCCGPVPCSIRFRFVVAVSLPLFWRFPYIPATKRAASA